MSAIDDFKRNVTDEQQAAYYSKWVGGNPNLAVKWVVFRDAIVAGQRPDPPDMGGNAYGRGLVDMGLTYLNATATTPIPPPRPSPTPTWPTPTKHLKAGDSFDALYPTLQGGDVVACESGVYPISAASHSKGGGNGNPIWFIPADPTKPPVFKGRFVTVPGGDDIRFTLCGFDGRNDTGAPSWTLGGARNEFDLCDFTNFNTGIGMHPVGPGAWGPASYVKVTNSRIHDIGRLPYGSTNNDHGLYDAGAGHTHFADVMVYNCSDRGLQLRGAKTALIEQVTVTHCGMGVIFGDIGAVGCVVRRCILTDNQATSRFLIEEYDPSGNDSNNLVDDCFAFNKDGRSTGAGGHSVAITNLHRTDPLLDVNLLPQAQAAAGYGCRVQPPRIVVA